MISVSPYQIDDYQTCPLKYKFIHVLRVPILQHHAVVYGAALHEAIRFYHQRKKENYQSPSKKSSRYLNWPGSTRDF